MTASIMRSWSTRRSSSPTLASISSTPSPTPTRTYVRSRIGPYARAATVTALSFGLFAGCSTGSSKTAAPTTTTKPTATTRQVASVVAEHQAQILDAISKESDCSIATLDAATDNAEKSIADPLAGDAAFQPLLNCEGALNSGLTVDAGAVANGLRALKPPAEVQQLATQTEAAARKVANEATGLTGCLPDGTAMIGQGPARYAADNKAFNCLIGVDGFNTDVKALQAALGGWAPYGG